MIGKEFSSPKQRNGKGPDGVPNFTEPHKEMELQTIIQNTVNKNSRGSNLKQI